jgi:hypothetical protein
VSEKTEGGLKYYAKQVVRLAWPPATFGAISFFYRANAELFPHFITGVVASTIEGVNAYVGEVRRLERKLRDAERQSGESMLDLQKLREQAAPVLNVGLCDVTPRGDRSGDWPKILKNAPGPFVFYGKTHGKLIEHSRPILTSLIEAGKSLEFFLPDAQFAKTTKEKDKRDQTEKSLRGMLDMYQGKGAHRGKIKVSICNHDPVFSYTNIGNRIYLGIYFPGMEHEHIPEFVIDKVEQDWLWERVVSAFETAFEDSKTLV